MSEPSIALAPTERITYRSTIRQVGVPQEESAVVRRNRTAEETNKQFNRLFRQIQNGPIYGSTARIERLSDAYRRTTRALDAAGRGDSRTSMATLISRRNNRRK